LEFSDKEHRLAGRRREQETPVFAERYAPRAGIESTNSGLKNRLGLDRLRVRGRGSVFRVILHKVAGWNVLRAAASTKLRARVKAQVEQALKARETGANEPAGAPVLWPWGGWLRAFRGSPGHSHRWAASHAA